MNGPKTILITGATGYIGCSLGRAALERGFDVHGSSRTGSRPMPDGVKPFVVGAGDQASSWSAALKGVDTVVHLAGRAHILREVSQDVLGTYRAANVAPTLALAQAALDAGVRRYVFVSSVGVYGAESRDHGFGPLDKPRPHNAYSQSKWEAEQGLHALTLGSSLELVVVRPPLVYGRGALGNFGALVRWLKTGWPLPLASVTGNRRSFVALDNLTDFILACVVHADASKYPWVVSDGEDLSTAQLLQRLAGAMGRSARLLPLPPVLLEWGARIVRRHDVYRRLCSSLQVDMTATQSVLGWHPVVSVDEGLRRAVQGEGR